MRFEHRVGELFFTARLVNADVRQTLQVSNPVFSGGVPTRQLHTVRNGLRRLHQQHLSAIMKRVSSRAEIGETRRLKAVTLEWLEFRLNEKPRRVCECVVIDSHCVFPWVAGTCVTS